MSILINIVNLTVVVFLSAALYSATPNFDESDCPSAAVGSCKQSVWTLNIADQNISLEAFDKNKDCMSIIATKEVRKVKFMSERGLFDNSSKEQSEKIREAYSLIVDIKQADSILVKLLSEKDYR